MSRNGRLAQGGGGGGFLAVIIQLAILFFVEYVAGRWRAVPRWAQRGQIVVAFAAFQGPQQVAQRR